VIADRLAEVRERIGAAARSAGRDPSSVRLVAVSKTFPADLIREAYAAGQRDFGENRVQEALDKVDACADLEVHWHLLGHLQTNKTKRAGAVFHTIHSVDSLDVLHKLDAAAAEAGTAPSLLIQVDLAGEETKYGIKPDAVMPIFDAAAHLRAAHVVGLMALPPYPEHPEDSRPWFRQLRELRDRWLADGVPPGMLRELSMGMSGDFEVAIQEGSTAVRVGTAIFGSRKLKVESEK
jgi:PLP dependent protein